MIEFKRGVYERALGELSRFLKGLETHEHYLARLAGAGGAEHGHG